MAVGPWARAAWRATVAFAGGTHHARPVVDGVAGVAYLQRAHGHWRVTTYSEHYIPGEGPEMVSMTRLIDGRQVTR